ncbi:MAG: hypothetical protein Q7R40_10795 [Phaeospirillum sp.]|nr:hypothetical protein [Phaeospirillum sp.]
MNRYIWASMMGRAYKVVVLNIVNLFILAVLLNLACLPLLPHLRRPLDSIAQADVKAWLQNWDRDLLLKLHPGKSYEDIVEIFADAARVHVVYEPFYEHRYPEYESKTFNVHAAGFRSIGKRQGPWPPPTDANVVFIFGGSTAMGGGVQDQDTIAAALQSKMRAASGKDNVFVYNFGVSAYQSTQEMLRFTLLLQQDIIPTTAIFLDGLNDMIIWNGEPALAPLLRSAANIVQDGVTQDSLGFHIGRFWARLPMVEVADRLAARTVTPSPFPQAELPTGAVDDSARAEISIKRYLSNRRMAKSIGDAYGVKTVFIWQPIPYYRYPFEKEAMTMLDAMPGTGNRYGLRAKYGYNVVLSSYMDRMRSFDGFHWCADAQENSSKMLYVDHVHYNADGSDLVAECIMEKAFPSP